MDRQSIPILVTGGAGYIGSHAVWALTDAGYPVVVIDNLSTGRRASLPSHIPFILGDIGDRNLLASVLDEHAIAAVMHFAGSIIVPESVERPLAYYGNNTINSHGLIEVCHQAGVKNFIFSSTAAVYGEPEHIPLTETAATRPLNPYGTSKLMTEWMLRDTSAAHGLRYAALRYFNVAGADAALRTGQSSPIATHLLKIAAEVATGKRASMSIFGEDYPTPDGTCIRDYIHVSDLADAHVLALEYLLKGGESRVMNCGYGHGFSVKEVIAAVEQVIGRPLTKQFGPRRAGDSPELVADSSLLRSRLGWTPRFDDLPTIIRTALAWEEKLAAIAA
ncbi:UDP-glucose 4-epimerase GalE [Radicibacter daui]|uniref:UDP-glucose 4-epimerase GalE n=1 Tax=Radicibacter daui TaxID=3064829 RepID=UPI004046B3EE